MKSNIQLKQQFFLLFTVVLFASCLTNVDEEVIVEEICGCDESLWNDDYTDYMLIYHLYLIPILYH